MANGWQGGPGMSDAELERMARQAWDAWREALDKTAPHAGVGGGSSAPFGMPGVGVPGAGPFGLPGGILGASAASADPWRDAIDWWSRYAASPGNNDIGNLVERFNGQARDWFGQMQQLASRFAGKGGHPKDIADAWRQALGGADANPFAHMLGSLQAPGVEGLDAWMARVAPFLERMRGGQQDWMQLPTFGVAREHQARWQEFAQAQADYQQSQQGYHDLLARASQAAFGIFERKLGEHAVPGQQIESPRALFDLWIDAAEEAYAEVALSTEFRTAYANLVNGQMRLRLAVQKEIEQVCRMVDMPTRTELDGAHRKIADLERSLRRLRDRMDVLSPRARPAHVSAGAARRASASTTTNASAAAATSHMQPAKQRVSGSATTEDAGGKTATTRGATKQVAGSGAAARAATDKAVAAQTVATPTAVKAPTRRKPVTEKKQVAAKKSASKKTVSKKAAPSKTPAKKTVTKKAPTKRVVAAKAASKSSVAKPVASKQAATKRAARKKTVASKAAPKKASAKQAVASQAPVSKRQSASVSRAKTRGRAKTAAASARTPAPRRVRSRTAAGAPSATTTATPRRAARKVAGTPSRAAPIPNYGFISPIPAAPEPMNVVRAKRAPTRKR